MNIKELTYPNLKSALNRMPSNQQREIETFATDLRESIRMKNGDSVMLGRQGALELIAKLGIFMNENDWDGKE